MSERQQAGGGERPVEGGISALHVDGEAPVMRAAAPMTFAQKKWVQEVLPWVTSAVLHLGVILAAVLLYQAGAKVLQVVKEQIIIPDATTADTGPIGGVPNPGLGTDPNRVAAQDQVADSTEREVRTQRLNATVASGTEGTNESVIGIGAGGSFSRGGKGGGDGDKAGGLFGVPGGGGGSGPPANFVGVRGNATKIVYLCDASGSMLSVFPALQRQLRQSVDGLRLPQSFGVIFFSDSAKSLTTSLMLANSDNKRKAFDFVQQQSPAGGTNPTDAIQKAFDLQPQLIFVLTDGFDQGDPKKIMEQFRRLNKDKKIKVNTILLKSADDPELVKLLKSIASDNGGVYKEVDKQDF